MKEKSEHLEELESKLTDSFYKEVVKLYKEQPTSSYIIEKLIQNIESKKNEISKSESGGV